MDVRGGKRSAGTRGVSRGSGTGRGAGNSHGAGSSRGMGSSRGGVLTRGVVSSRGVRGWRGKRGRGNSQGRGGRMGNSAKDPVPPPADVPLTRDEQRDAVPVDTPAGTRKDKASVPVRGQSHMSGEVVQLLQSTIAMREQVATWPGRSASAGDKHTDTSKDPFLDTLNADPGVGERLNVFEQFKIPFDTSGKQDTVTLTQGREKIATGAGVKKTNQKSCDVAAVGKRPPQHTWSSSMEEETKERFDSRELSDMRVIKVIKVIKRVRGRPKQLARSSPDISQVRRQSSSISVSNVTKSVPRGQPRGRRMARGGRVARVWPAAQGEATQQIPTAAEVETFGRPATSTSASGTCGRSTTQERDQPAQRFQRRQRGRPRVHGLSGLRGRTSSSSRGMSCKSIELRHNTEQPDPVDLLDGFESNDGGSGGGAQHGSATPRDDTASRRSSISTECSELEDRTAFFLASKNRGRGKIRGNILWKYRGRGRRWLAKHTNWGKLDTPPRGSEQSQNRGQGRGRGRRRAGLSTSTVTLQSLRDDSRHFDYPASASSNQFSDVNSTESESVTSTAEHSDTARKKSTRGCRARGRGGTGRGNRKTVVLGKKTKTSSLLVVAAKKVQQDSSVAKMLKRRKKKKVFTIRKRHTTGLKCIRRKPVKDRNKDSAESTACQESTVTDMPNTEPPEPLVDPQPGEPQERASAEETAGKKVKRKYHRHTNNSSQSSVVSLDGSETDTSSVPRSEILLTDAAVVKPKLCEPAVRTTTETASVVPKKMKRKYVRKVISSQLCVVQGGSETDTSTVAKSEITFTDAAVGSPKPGEATVRTTTETAAVVPKKVKRKYVRKVISSQPCVVQGGSETDTSSVAKSEILSTDAAVGNQKPGEAIVRTTTETAAVVPKKVKRKYVRKVISSQLCLTQGGAQSKMSSVARRDIAETVSTDKRATGAVAAAPGAAVAGAVKPKRKYNWRMLSKKLAEAKVTKTTGGPRKSKQGSDKMDGRKKIKPTTLAKTSMKASKPKGGAMKKKKAQGMSRQTSQTDDLVKQTNSGSDKANKDDNRDSVDSTDIVRASYKNNTVALNSGNKTVRDSAKTVKPGRKPKVPKIVATSGPDLGRPPSPSGSCDSLSSNEPLKVLQPKGSQTKPDPDEKSNRSVPKESAVEAKHDEKDKKVDVKVKSVKQTADVIDLKESCSGVSGEEKHYVRLDNVENIGMSDVPMKDDAVPSSESDKKTSCVDCASADTTCVRVTTDTSDTSDTSDVSSIRTDMSSVWSGAAVAAGEVDSLLSPHVPKTPGDGVKSQAVDEISSVEKQETRKRKTYKRRSALELLNDVDGPPSRLQRYMMVRNRDQDTSTDTTSTEETTPVKKTGKDSAQEETDNEVHIEASSLTEITGNAESVSVGKGITSTVEKVIDSIVAKVAQGYGIELNNEISTTSSVSKQTEKSTMIDEKCADPVVVEKAESCTAEVDEQLTPGGTGKKRTNKKITEQTDKNASKGPRKKYKAAKQKIEGVWKQTYKGVKRKYKAHKLTDDELISRQHQCVKKRQKLKEVAVSNEEDDKPNCEAEAPPPKSYSVKRMTTRGKKNRYWYLFAKQTKMPAAADAEVDSCPRSGSVQDMLRVCRPCRVMLVDFLKCLNFSRLAALSADNDAASETEIATLTISAAPMEPAVKVAKLNAGDDEEKRIGECVGAAAVDGDTTSGVGSRQRTDTSSPSSSEDTHPLVAARIPRTVGADDAPPRKRPQKPLRRFQCNVCAFKTSIRNLMDEHVFSHTSVEPYACGHCGKAFSTRDGVVTHTRLDHHGALFDIVRRPQRRRSGYYTVRRVRPKQSRLEPEEEEEEAGAGAGVRPRIPTLDAVNPQQPYYQCKRCTYATNSVVTMQRHVLDAHTGDRRLICALCDRAYCRTEHGMTKHYKRWHADAAVQLRYEPDYYEVWDVKEAEANGVDAASCTVLTLPGAGGDAASQLHGQPLIGQPLIVQPGQTFLTQKALSSEHPQVTQPLTLQPSVRTVAKVRSIADHSPDENDAIRAKNEPQNSVLTDGHAPQRSTHLPTTDSAGCGRNNPPMPLLSSVETYAAPSTGLTRVEQQLRLGENSSVDCDTSTGPTGTDATQTRQVDELDRQKDESSSAFDGLRVDDECGSAAVPDTMPHLEKSAAHEQSDTEEPPPLVPCLLPFAAHREADSTHTWPATRDHAPATRDHAPADTNDETATVNDTTTPSKPSGHGRSDVTEESQLPVGPCDATITCSDVVTSAATTDTIGYTVKEADVTETRDDELKGDMASLEGRDTDDTHDNKTYDKEMTCSDAEVRDVDAHDLPGEQSDLPSDGTASSVNADGVCPVANDGDRVSRAMSTGKQGEMPDSPVIPTDDTENIERRTGDTNTTPTVVDSGDNSVANNGGENIAASCSPPLAEEEVPPRVVTPVETAVEIAENDSPDSDDGTLLDTDTAVQESSAPTEVTTAVGKAIPDNRDTDILAHSTDRRQASDLPLGPGSDNDGLPATTSEDLKAEAAATPTDVASSEVGSDGGTSCYPVTGPREATVAVVAPTPITTSTAELSDISGTGGVEKPADTTTNGSAEKSGESDTLASCASARGNRPVSPIAAPCSITDVRSLAARPLPLPLIQCQMCSLRLRDQDQMMEHVSVKHNVDLWFACPYCQLGCSPQRANIVRHIEKSHASQPVDVPINIVNSDKYFRLTTATGDVQSTDEAVSTSDVALVTSANAATAVKSVVAPTLVTSAQTTPSTTVMTIGQVIMMAYHDESPDSFGTSDACPTTAAAILPRTTVPESMTSPGPEHVVVTTGVDLRLVSSSNKTPVSDVVTPTETLKVISGGVPPRTLSDPTKHPVAGDDDDIIFVKSQPASKRRLVAVRAPLPPGVAPPVAGASAQSLQAQLRRPLTATTSMHHQNVTNSLRHPIMSSVPVVRPAHTGLAPAVNQNHVTPPNSYVPVGSRLPPPPAGHYPLLGNIRPAHMNNVVSSVGAQARPAHANPVTSMMRRGPPPLIPLTLLDGGRAAAEGARPPPTSGARMMIPGVRPPVVSRPLAPVVPRSPAVINIADDDDDDDAAIKESFSVFNLRPRLRAPSPVYRPPGGVAVPRPVRAPPPPYQVAPPPRHVTPPLARRPPPPAAHQFGARLPYNSSGTQVKRCPHCPYETDNRAALHDHIVGHGSIVRWACPYCSVLPQPTKEVIAEHIHKHHPRFPVVYKPFGV